MLLLRSNIFYDSTYNLAILSISMATTINLKWIRQFPIRNLQHLILDVLYDRPQLEKVLLRFNNFLECLDLFFLHLFDNILGQMFTCPLS